MTTRIYNGENRAVSPVIGTVLFVTVVVLLAAISGAFIFELTEQQDPAPQAKLALEPVESSNDYRLVHKAGDTIDGDQVAVRGVDDSNVLSGTTISAGMSVLVTPTADEIQLVWEEQRRDPSSYILSTFKVDSGTPSGSGMGGTTLPDSVAFTGTSSGIRKITGDGFAYSDISTAAEPKGLGPATDIDSDGTIEIPYVDSSGKIKLVETDDGSETLLAESSDSAISGSIQTSETRMAVGTWSGSPQSVFFANENEDALYRVAPGGSVVEVTPLSDGPSGVLGIRDIDSDSDDEVVYIGSSDEIRYLNKDGSTGSTGITADQNNGVGAGSIADYDGDGDAAVAMVESGQIRLAGATWDHKITDSDIQGGTAPSSVTKAPPTAADVDDDTETELLYVASGGDLRYLDELGGLTDITVRDLTDENKNAISGDDYTGVV